MAHYANTAFETGKDPATAALLSVVPGLGQFYNGESRKGILFLDVALINAALLFTILFTTPIVDGLKTIGASSHMKVNAAVLCALNNFHIGSPVSLIVLGMIVTFAAYAARDAYDHAVVRRRRAIYADLVVAMPEATSGSYIMHSALIVALAVIAMFFFIPKPPAKQITEIEFISQEKQVIVHPPKDTNIKSNNPSEQHGRHNPDKEVNHQPAKNQEASHAAQQQAKPAEQAHKPAQAAEQAAQHAAQPAQASQPAPPVPVFKPITSASAPAAAAQLHAPQLPSANPSSAMAHLPKLASITSSVSAPALPTANTQTTAQAPSLPNPISAPLLGREGTPAPVAVGPNNLSRMLASALPGVSNDMRGLPSGSSSNVPSFGPRNGSSNGHTGDQSGPPSPLTNASNRSSSNGNQTGTNPSPIVGETGGPKSSGKHSAPAPYTAGRGTHSGPVEILPSVGTATGDKPANNASDTDDRPSTPGASSAPVDFGPYMAQLQRQIKRNWFPPKDGEARKIKVRFKIHSNGQMSALHIVQSANSDLCDQAALTAVNNAAPFMPLPKGAPDAVDIEFTFDYNVFKGRF